MALRKSIILGVLLLLLAPVAARAQTPADSAGVLLGVATQLRTEGRAELAKSILDLIIQRFRETPAGTEALRMRSEMKLVHLEQSGRTELMVYGTAYGLFLGAAVPAALDSESPTAYGLGLIVGAPTGFLLSRAYAKSRNLTEGQARAITFGATWGTWQGFGWAEVLEFGSEKSSCQFDCYYDSGPSGPAVLKSMIVGGLAGIGVGAALSHKPITAGTATTVNFGALWGTWYGFAFAALGDTESDAALTAALIAGNAGIVATALAAPSWKLSRARARLISISGVAGLVAGLGVAVIAQAEDNTAILLPIATSAIGLGLGAKWTRSMAPDAGAGQGLLDVGRKQFGLEMPSIQPRVVERVRDGRLERVPAIGLTLFQARF